ncbi:hypothetical protein CQ046_00480 [Chryseobacterium sp. MYb7]|uniref:hypothetical protein n=1 Tax=Chryseobacterium sp. MYb7 TaxID=1827290 RepID=UPI000D00EA2D|nr:hypothetical protein [Chryseobacterium sp. MYb7]PRB06606.1 hypothetical protein CQ046_00480 [Chryseobacterium sp. MYb7]
MKKILVLIILLSIKGYSAKINFKDPNFKSKLLLENVAKDINGKYIIIDQNNDKEIDENEGEKIFYLDISNSKIKNLDGIKNFKNLIYLNCTNNSIYQIDELNYLENLTDLEIENNSIEIFSLNNKQKLKSIMAEKSGIKNVKLENCLSLEIILFANNQIENIEISFSPLLKAISVEIIKSRR